MPTYEYRCDKCGQHLEVVQSFADRPLRRHQQCGGDLERVFHPRGVVFKGSGWYKTDSRPKQPSESKDGDGTSKKTTEKKSEPAPAATSAAGSEAAD